MSELEADTRVSGADGSYTGELSGDWEIWGPMGGYAASTLVRAAAHHTGRARPASINVHFAGASQVGPVDITVETMRETRVGTSVRLTARQDDRLTMTALLWAVDDLTGLEHHTSEVPPPADPPDAVPSMADRIPDPGDRIQHPFMGRLESRPNHFVDYETVTSPIEPRLDTWYRLRPIATYDDPWVDACRLLVIVDLDGWPATTRAHLGSDFEYFAPTIELSCRFLADASDQPYVRSIAHAPIGHAGLIAHRGDVWTVDNRLVATGGSTLLCRPAARRPDQHLAPPNQQPQDS